VACLLGLAEALAQQADTDQASPKQNQCAGLRGSDGRVQDDVIKAVRVVASRIGIDEIERGRGTGRREGSGELLPGLRSGRRAAVGGRIDQRAADASHKHLYGARRSEDTAWIEDISHPK
jgi:hypothetical protein